ncbi:MAG: ArsR family transcriptional regulator [Actinomycetota bacterium]|jgi:predicted ArsR family transcriptional regulator|nr:MAG: ArsR family transcriptional regulator [Actinomycetota bacterium]
MTEPAPIEVHKALADDTRYRLYRYLRRSGRAVPIRELAARLSLHPNTLRPHLRRLQEAGLVVSESRRGPGVGRPQALYAAAEPDGRAGRDYRLLADILAGLVRGGRQLERAEGLAREWGAYLVGRRPPRPGTRRPAGPNLAALQEALAEAGFDPRFRRTGRAKVEITLRDCPFRDLLDEHRELVCAVHRGLLEGMLVASRPPLRLVGFEPLRDRSSVCRLTAGIPGRSGA